MKRGGKTLELGNGGLGNWGGVGGGGSPEDPLDASSPSAKLLWSSSNKLVSSTVTYQLPIRRSMGHTKG